MRIQPKVRKSGVKRKLRVQLQKRMCQTTKNGNTATGFGVFSPHQADVFLRVEWQRFTTFSQSLLLIC